MCSALSLVRPEPSPRDLGEFETAAVWNMKAVAERKIRLLQLEQYTASISEVSAGQQTVRGAHILRRTTRLGGFYHPSSFTSNWVGAWVEKKKVLNATSTKQNKIVRTAACGAQRSMTERLFSKVVVSAVTTWSFPRFIRPMSAFVLSSISSVFGDLGKCIRSR